MTTLITNCLANVCDQPNEPTHQHFLDGQNDAKYGRLPEYADAIYLDGYVTQLKQLPTAPNGRIRHYSPRQHFAFGLMDGIGHKPDGESNYDC